MHYVRFAGEHPAHFQVMFQPDLLPPRRPGTPRGEGPRPRRNCARRSRPPPPGAAPTPVAGIAAWSLAHGFATLLLSRNLDGPVGDRDPEEVFRALTGLTFKTPPG